MPDRKKPHTSLYGQAAFISTVCLLFLCQDALAWHTLQHGALAREAFIQLPEDMQEKFTPWLDQIVFSALEPDISIMDGDNHEWNIHKEPGDTTAGPVRIEALYRLAEAALIAEPPDLETVSRYLGLISRYIADLNQPLHTDAFDTDEDVVHVAYEMDVYANQGDLSFEDRGRLLVDDIYSEAIAAAEHANPYYESILKAYRLGKGYENTRGITRLCCQRAVDDIADIWTTLWAGAMKRTPSLFLRVNDTILRPGDTLEITASALPGRDGRGNFDLYLLLETLEKEYTFLGPGPLLSTSPVPFSSSWQVDKVVKKRICALSLAEPIQPGHFILHGLLVKAGGDVMNMADWASEPVAISFDLEDLPSANRLLDEISNDIYIFPARLPDGSSSYLPIMRWDLIFMGYKKDDPATLEDETLFNNAIFPGNYSHLMLYLGLDRHGMPCALEMVPDVMGKVNLRITSFYYSGRSIPEFPVEPSLLPVFTEDIGIYDHRNAMRFRPDLRDRALYMEETLMERIAQDMDGTFSYQYEYDWSGDLSDPEIRLVDDGRENGAGCTDYMISLFEDYAGICMKGARMTAAEVTDYFLNDPKGSLAPVPDFLNPFPYKLRIRDILDMGYYVVDSPAHIFPCDNSTETGVPVPSRLIKSPALVPVEDVAFPTL